MITWKVDWLTLTKNKWDVETDEIDNSASALAWASIAAQEVGLWLTEYRRAVGSRFYPWAFECALSGIKVHVPRDPGVQGIMIVFSGKVLSGNVNPMNIIATALDHGWKVTRVDVAVDFVEEGFSVEDIHSEYLLNSSKDDRTIGWIKSRNGDTFTIGSRQSERFARVYDKGKEQKVGHSWVRVEVEYKGRASMVCGETLVSNSGSVLGDIAAFFARSNPMVSSAIGGLAKEHITKLKLPMRVSGDRERWFYGQVSSALSKWAESDYDRAREWLTAMLWRLDQGI